MKRTFCVDKVIEPFYKGGRVVAVEGRQIVLVPGPRHSVSIRDAKTLRQLSIIKDEVSTTMDEEEEGTESTANSTLFGFEETVVRVLPRGILEVWSIADLDSPSMLRSWKTASNAPASCLARTDDLLAVGFTDGVVRVFDLRGGFAVANLKGQHGGVIAGLLFTDAKTLVAAGEDGAVTVWDVAGKSKLVKSMQPHKSAITALTMSGDCVATVSRDATVTLYNKADMGVVKNAPLLEALESAVFVAPDRLAVAGDRGTVRIVNVVEGTMIESERIAASGHLIRQLLSFGDQLLAVTSELNIITLDTTSTALSINATFVGNHGEVTDIQCLSDGRMIVATGDADISVYRDIHSHGCTFLKGHAEAVICLAASEDGRLLVSGSRDNAARVWCMESNECLAVVTGHTDIVSAVAIVKADNSDYLIATASSDLTVKMWKFTNATRIVVNLWTVKAHDKDINALCFATPGILLSASQDKTAKVWDVAKGVLRKSLTGHKRGVWSIACHRDVVATGSADKTIKIWSLGAGQVMQTLEGHANSVLRVLLADEGRGVYSVGSDGLLNIWDARSGGLQSSHDEHSDRIWALAKSDAGSLVTGDSLGVVKVWRDCTAEMEERGLAERAELAKKEQELANLLRRKDYKHSALMTIRMRQPGRTHSILSAVIHERGFPSAIELISEIASVLSEEEMDALSGWTREWNANFRKSLVANLLVKAIFLNVPVAEIPAKLKGFAEVARSFVPYSERHIRRINEMTSNSYMIDLALARMN